MKPVALNWNDPEAIKAWLRDMRERVDDVIAVARDQTLPLSKRRLGRVEAKRLLEEASAALSEQFAYAQRGVAS